MSQGATGTPVAKAIKILNNQLLTLTAIDGRASQLEALLPQLKAQSD